MNKDKATYEKASFIEADNKKFLKYAKEQMKNFRKNDPFLTTSFKLTTIAKKQNHYVTVLLGKNKKGTFSIDNYGAIPIFCTQNYNLINKGVSIIIQKVEKGPVEPISKKPYKTIASAYFNNKKNTWIPLTEKQMKVYLTTNPQTKKREPLESGVLLSTIPELFPKIDILGLKKLSNCK